MHTHKYFDISGPFIESSEADENDPNHTHTFDIYGDGTQIATTSAPTPFTYPHGHTTHVHTFAVDNVLRLIAQ